MKKLLVCLFLAGALVSNGCGYSSNSSGYGANPITPGTVTYNETLNTGDSFNDQILRFKLTVSSFTLTGMSPTATTGNLLSQPAQIEFVHQAAAFEPLALANIPAGTYTAATFTVSNPNVVVLNSSGSPGSVTANLTAPTVTVNFSPAITIMSTSISTLNFDLDLAGSVTLNGSPATSATVNPKFNVTTSPIGASANQDVSSGDIEDLHGTLMSISNSSFTLQTSQAAIPFLVSASTGYGGGSSQLSGFNVGDLVEVDGYTNSDGTKLASRITKDGGSTGQEVEGIIATVTGSPATDLMIADQLNSVSSATPPTTVDVAINATTTFSVRPDKLNIISMPAFDATRIGKGQRVEADGATAGFPTIATSLKLREQALLGTVAAMPAPTSSSFTINLSAASAFSKLSGTTSVAVTVPSGATLKVTPTAGATMLLRGLVFVNGSTYTMIATRGE
jgi:uncharacterized protein DUF5666